MIANPHQTEAAESSTAIAIQPIITKIIMIIAICLPSTGLTTRIREEQYRNNSNQNQVIRLAEDRLAGLRMLRLMRIPITAEVSPPRMSRDNQTYPIVSLDTKWLAKNMIPQYPLGEFKVIDAVKKLKNGESPCAQK